MFFCMFVAILFFYGDNAEIFSLSLFCIFEVIKFKDVAFLIYASGIFVPCNSFHVLYSF